MSAAFARAFRETLGSRGLLVVWGLGTLMSLASSASLAGAGQLLTITAMLLTLGYQLSYTREVALNTKPVLPPLGDVGTFLRRGLGQFAITSVSLVLLIPLLLLMNIASTFGWAVSSTGFAVIFIGVFLVLLPAYARYAFYDRVSEGFRCVRAIQEVRSVGVIAIAPVLVGGSATVLQQLLRSGWRRVFDAPQTTWWQAAETIRAGSVRMQDVSLIVLSVALAAFGFLVALVTSHLLGQVARRAFSHEEASAVALTSASS